MQFPEAQVRDCALSQLSPEQCKGTALEKAEELGLMGDRPSHEWVRVYRIEVGAQLISVVGIQVVQSRAKYGLGLFRSRNGSRACGTCRKKTRPMSGNPQAGWWLHASGQRQVLRVHYDGPFSELVDLSKAEHGMARRQRCVSA